MDYCGECPVCEEPVDHDEAGFCSECGMAFHWGECGDWHRGQHCCQSCADRDDNTPQEDK